MNVEAEIIEPSNSPAANAGSSELGFREPRRRAEYKLSMTEAYRSAVVLTTNAARVKVLKKEGYTLAQARRMATKEILT